MDIYEVKKIIDDIFSEDGYKILGFSLSCPKNLSCRLTKTDKGLDLSFDGDLPTVNTRKFLIPLAAKIEGIYLGEDGGSLKIKYLPDVQFKYGDNHEENFGASPVDNLCLESISAQIDKKFEDVERRKIAKLALQYTHEWATIVSQNGMSIRYCDDKTKNKLKKDCENFVLENMRNSKDIEAKSAILTFILMYVVLPMVIKWVIERFFN